MARQLIFDVRFRDANNVGQLVGGDLYVELYEEGETRPKEIRYIGTNSGNQIIKAVDGDGTLYTTTVDVTNYARGAVTAKWYAKLLGSPVSPYPYVESIPNVFADTELTVGDLKNYIRSMLGFPSVTVELTGAHYTAIMEEALAFYGQHIPAERVIRLNYLPSIQVYHLPDLPYNGPYDVKFVRKVVTPFACLTGDTVVRLLDGTNRTIQDLAENYPEDEMWVYSVDRKTKKYVPGRAIKPKKTGENVPVFRVTLDDGSSYRCTETHRWLLRDGSFRQCKDLAPGDSLMPLYTRISAQPRDNLSSYEMIKNLRHGEWQYTHRMVANGYYGHDFIHKETAKSLAAGTGPAIIHHAAKDSNGQFDKLNNDPSSLKIMTRDAHTTLHGNTWTPERKHSMLGVQMANIESYNNWHRLVLAGEVKVTYQTWLSGTDPAVDEEEKLQNWLNERKESCSIAAKAANERWADPKVHAARVAGINRSWNGEGGEERRRKMAETWAKKEPVYSDEFKQKIVRMSISGVAQWRIADDLGIPVRHVADVLTDASIFLGLTEDVRSSIIELKVAGLSRSKIAQKIGVGEGKVRKVLEKFNHKVVSVEPCGFEDVYNLGVYDHNNYAICTLDKCGKVVSACMTGNSDPVFGREYLRANEPDMGTMIIGNAYLETMLRVLSSEPDWRWLHETKELYVNIGPGISAQVYGGYDVSVRYFVPVTLDKVREDHFRWMRRYCLSQAKKILAQIRGKFSGNVPAPGGPLMLNHEDLARQGAEEELQLADELRSMAQHVPPIFG